MRRGSFRRAKAVLRDRTGAGAVEFALVLPAVLMVIVGGINLCLVSYTLAGLHYATEAAARCASLDSTTCGNSAGVDSYAKTKFINASGQVASFALTTASCGSAVTGTVNYKLNIGIKTLDLPLRADSCAP